MSKSKKKEITSKEQNQVQEKPIETNISEGTKRTWSATYMYGTILLLSCVIYASAVGNDYALDDLLAITGNKFVLQGIDGFKDIFTKDAFVGFFGDRGATLISGGRYRPLAFATFAIEYQIFGLNPHLSHFINVLLYGVLCCFLCYFLNQIPKRFWPELTWKNWSVDIPFIVTILYALHPIHTEVVANIKGRDEILALMFALLSVVFFLRGLLQKQKAAYLMAALFLFLGLLSKENPITFLAVIPLMVGLFYSEKLKDSKFYVGMICLVAVAGMYLFLRSTYTATSVTDESPEILNNPFVRAVGDEKWATVFYSFLMYFKLLIFPHPLTHDYYFNQIPYKHFSDISVLVSIALHLVACYVFVVSRKKNPIVSFAIGFYFITLSIVSNIPFTVGIIMNERFVFVSSIGFTLLLTILLAQAVSRKQLPAATIGFLLPIVCILFAVKTFSRNYAWENNHVLFETDVKTSTNSAKVTTALAADYLELADSTTDQVEQQEWCDKSLTMVEQSLRIYPENSGAYLLKGNAIFKRNKNYDSAIICFKTALNYRPKDYFDGNYNLAATYMNMKKYDSSLIYAKEAFRINPQHASTAGILAYSYLMTGNMKDATEMYEKQGKLENKVLFSDEVSKNLFFADHMKEAGKADQALDIYEVVLKQNPNDPGANYGKGIILGKVKNQVLASIPYLEKAVALDDSKTAWKEDLAVAYGFSGQYAKTIPLLERVIKDEPEYANAYSNLATSYNLLGQKEKATYYSRLASTKKPK